MYDDEQDDFDLDEIFDLVHRFEEMIEGGSYSFFDLENLEDIIDHYFQINNKNRALQAINFAAKQYPKAAGILLRQAQYLMAESKNEQALELLNEAEILDPDNIDLHLAKGFIYNQKGFSEQAVNEFEKALSEAEYPEEVSISIAFEFENQGNPDMAIVYFKKSLELDPNNEAALYEIAYCFEMTSQFDEAVVFFTSFIDKNPYSITAWFNLGLAYNSLELYEKAIESYDFVIAIDETFASAYFNKANSYANMGMYREAIEFYRQTFIYEDPEAITYYYLGECYQKLTRFDEAINAYKKALEFDPNLSDAWFELGITYDEIGQTSEGIRQVEKATSLEPDNMEMLYILAGLYTKARRLSDAKKAYKKIISSKYDGSDPWLDYAEMLAKNEETLSAIGILTKAIHLYPDDAILVYRLAAYRFTAGWIKEAIRTLDKALTMDFSSYDDIAIHAPQMLKLPEVVTLIESHKPVGTRRQRKRQQ